MTEINFQDPQYLGEIQHLMNKSLTNPLTEEEQIEVVGYAWTELGNRMLDEGVSEEDVHKFLDENFLFLDKWHVVIHSGDDPAVAVSCSVVFFDE